MSEAPAPRGQRGGGTELSETKTKPFYGFSTTIPSAGVTRAVMSSPAFSSESFTSAPALIVRELPSASFSPDISRYLRSAMTERVG